LQLLLAMHPRDRPSVASSAARLTLGFPQPSAPSVRDVRSSFAPRVLTVVLCCLASWLGSGLGFFLACLSLSLLLLAGVLGSLSF